jgi:hypothetical protein
MSVPGVSTIATHKMPLPDVAQLVYIVRWIQRYRPRAASAIGYSTRKTSSVHFFAAIG